MQRQQLQNSNPPALQTTAFPTPESHFPDPSPGNWVWVRSPPPPLSFNLRDSSCSACFLTLSSPPGEPRSAGSGAAPPVTLSSPGSSRATGCWFSLPFFPSSSRADLLPRRSPLGKWWRGWAPGEKREDALSEKNDKAGGWGAGCGTQKGGSEALAEEEEKKAGMGVETVEEEEELSGNLLLLLLGAKSKTDRLAHPLPPRPVSDQNLLQLGLLLPIVAKNLSHSLVDSKILCLCLWRFHLTFLIILPGIGLEFANFTTSGYT